MSSTRRFITIFAATLLATAIAAGTERRPRGPNVLVVADAIGEDVESLRPTPDRPVYYVILGGAKQTIGQSTRGVPMPTAAEVEALVDEALASQGFVRAEVGGPMPSIAIVMAWGEANPMIDEYPSMDFDDDPFSDLDDDPFSDFGFGGESTTVVVWNRREMRQLVGANKPGLLNFIEADMVNDAAGSDRLYITIAALDAQALVRKEKKLVWRTRISIFARRQRLPDALPVMLASAAPLFGSGETKPVFIGDRERLRTEVVIGELKVVDDEIEPPDGTPEEE